ncbi:MAG: WbqC family protein [Bacteroidota bacterium]
MSILLPTAYLPPLSYMSLLLRNGQVCIEAQEHFVKKTLRNRCRICGANGTLLLSVPVDHDNRWRKPIHEIGISQQEEWKKSHWKSIESAYAHAPYFEFYEEEFRKVLFDKHKTLTGLNQAFLLTVLRWLKLEKKLHWTSEFDPYSANHNDYRRNWDQEPAVRHSVVYKQVFEAKLGFQDDLSIIDLIFNTGPDALGYL